MTISAVDGPRPPRLWPRRLAGVATALHKHKVRVKLMTLLAASRERAPPPIPGLIRRLGVEFSLYFLVSLLALGVDFGGLVLLKEVFHVYYLIASAVSYMTGAVVQYLLSIAFVFRDHRMRNRWAEFAAFALLGLLGLGATQVVLWLSVGILGFNYLAGKVMATGVSFVLNYTARRALLFSAGRTGGG